MLQIVIFQDAFMWALSPHSLHLLNSTDCFTETGTVNAFYDFITEQVIARRNEPEGTLMSDKEAYGYIDMLIQQVKADKEQSMNGNSN